MYRRLLGGYGPETGGKVSFKPVMLKLALMAIHAPGRYDTSNFNLHPILQYLGVVVRSL